MSSPEVNRSQPMHDREAVFYLVFESLFDLYTPREILDTAYAADIFEINDNIERKFLEITERGEELDKIIASASEKRKLARVPKISIAILRVALYEIIYDNKIHENISVSEAVRFAEDFASEQDVKFINGVLGGYLRMRKNAVLRS
ncbi:MAG: transcription antitermination factor NusB [Ruminococcus sp.]|jgi:N utilization substance protein B|nr:transcription antitermination factor NusB [Ruminococcus sp.]